MDDRAWPGHHEWPSVLVMCAVVAIAQNPAGEGTAMLAVFQQNLAVDDGHVDALRRLTNPHRPGREVMHDLVRQRADGVGIEDHNIRHQARLQQAPVVQPKDRGRFER